MPLFSVGVLFSEIAAEGSPLIDRIAAILAALLLVVLLVLALAPLFRRKDSSEDGDP